MREYDLIADWYARDANRGTWAGVPEVTSLAESIPPGARVLDIGCGQGKPLTNVLLDRGCRVVGLDSSANMLALFHRHFPTVPVVRGQIETANFASESFDAAHMWGVMFHLTLDRQRVAIAEIARVLRPGAPLLFTSGDLDEHDDHKRGVGEMNGVTFYYYTFKRAEYAEILEDHGMSLVETHIDRGQNMYYLACKGGG